MRPILLILVSFVVLTGFQTPSLPTKVCASAEEMKLYNLIMEYRKSKKLETIPFSGRLTLVAQTHAKDLAENYEFKANNRCNPHSWSKKGKWTSCCYTNNHKQAQCMWDKPKELTSYKGNGFEIAYGSSDPRFAGHTATAEAALNSWKKSPSHNDVILNRNMWKDFPWKAIGIGMNKGFAVIWFGNEPDKN